MKRLCIGLCLALVIGCASHKPYPTARDTGDCVAQQSAGHNPGVGPLRECVDRKARLRRGSRSVAATFFGDVFDTLLANWLGLEPVD